MENMNLKFGALLLVGLLFVAIVPFADAGIRDQNKAARAKYAAAKSDFAKMKNEYTKARQDYLNAKKQFGNKDKATLESARTFILKADKATIAHLETVKSFVEADWSLDQSQKDKITSALDKDISWLEGKQSEIETADRAGLIAIGKDIKSYWSNVKVDLKKYIGEILNARASWVLGEADKADGIIVKNIQRASDAGKDTTSLNAFLDDFRSKKDLAQAQYDKAKSSFSSISSLKDADKLFKEGNSFIKQGNSYVREAYGDLRSINSELRG